MAAIFFFSSLPGSRVPGVLPDFVPHFVEYMILGVLVFQALSATKAKLPTPLVAGWATLVSVLYALSDEIHQLYVPGRTFSGRDLAADGLGVLIAVALAGYARALRSRT